MRATRWIKASCILTPTTPTVDLILISNTGPTTCRSCAKERGQTSIWWPSDPGIGWSYECTEDSAWGQYPEYMQRGIIDTNAMGPGDSTSDASTDWRLLTLEDYDLGRFDKQRSRGKHDSNGSMKQETMFWRLKHRSKTLITESHVVQVDSASFTLSLQW